MTLLSLPTLDDLHIEPGLPHTDSHDIDRLAEKLRQ
ncbi:TauD/TfdA family dioxygenase, partial [Burkholderia contaminans]|nr:TauD/TfdA family dioxygenase [Burkholderia contaminans]